jgi:hypothetical protein
MALLASVTIRRMHNCFAQDHFLQTHPGPGGFGGIACGPQDGVAAIAFRGNRFAEVDRRTEAFCVWASAKTFELKTSISVNYGSLRAQS